MAITFTCEGRLDKRLAPEVLKYLDAYAPDFGAMRRYAWRDVRLCKGGLPCGKTEYNARLQRLFGVTKRTANSLILDAQGRWRALKELKKTELEQLSQKVGAQEKKAAKLQGKVDKAKARAVVGELGEKGLERLRRLKAALWQHRRKLARLRDRKAELEREIACENLRLGFGSKRLFRAQFHLEENRYGDHGAWHEDFCRARDSYVFYVGSKDEASGNLMCQLRHVDGDLFSVKVRKDGRFAEKGKRCRENWVEGLIRMGHLFEELEHNLAEGRFPVSVRLLRRDGKQYLQTMFRLDPETHPRLTCRAGGVIGCDLNDGHVELTETDAAGNVVGMWSATLEFHGCGAKAENEVRQLVSEVGDLAVAKGKDLAIEALDFSGKKAKRLKGVGRERNRMLHTLDYSRFATCVANMGERRGVGVHKVNPAFTSKIAAQKYNSQRCLPSHNGAAYVIARRAQGFHDRYERQ